MKTYWVLGVVALAGRAALLTVGLRPENRPTDAVSARSDVADEKIYVALEGEGTVAVLNAADNTRIGTIDLSESADGGAVRYMAHNVQVAPDGRSVLVTANVEEAMDMGGEEMPDMQVSHGENFDQLIIINPLTDEVTKRIPIDTDSHLAHVVLAPDNKT